jgi:hypothetical protein
LVALKSDFRFNPESRLEWSPRRYRDDREPADIVLTSVPSGHRWARLRRRRDDDRVLHFEARQTKVRVAAPEFAIPAAGFAAMIDLDDASNEHPTDNVFTHFNRPQTERAFEMTSPRVCPAAMSRKRTTGTRKPDGDGCGWDPSGKLAQTTRIEQHQWFRVQTRADGPEI